MNSTMKVAQTPRDADDAIRGIEELMDYPLQRMAFGKSINNEGAGYEQDGQTHYPPAELDEHEGTNDSHRDLNGADVNGFGHNGLKI